MKCLICDTEFEPKNSLQKFCSNDCKKKSNTRTELNRRSNQRKFEFDKMNKIKNCLVCGNEFELRQQHRGQKYCSEKCSKKAERLFGSKSETDLEYKNQIRFNGKKYEVLKRDDYECQICGNKSNLIIHHKDHSGQSNNPNNDVDNLITLCRKCHINIHKIGI